MDYLRKEIDNEIVFLEDEVCRLLKENSALDDLDFMRAYNEGKIRAYKDQIYTYKTMLEML